MTTRVCIKQLPKHLTEKRLKDHFERFGTVTDCKIMKSRDGKSRMFGFIGFSSESAAKQALVLNNTYLDTSKIIVEKAVDSESVSRPWSKYSAGSSAFNKAQELEKQKQLTEQQKKKDAEEKLKNKRKGVGGDGDDDIDENDPEYQEFKRMHQRTQRNNWSNNDDDRVKSEDAQQDQTKKKRKIEHDYKKNKDLIVFDDDIKGATTTTGEDDDDDDDLYEDMPIDNKSNDTNETEENKLAKDSAISDLDWLKSKMNNSNDKEDSEDDEDEDENEEEEEESEEEEEEEEEKVKKVEKVKEVKGGGEDDEAKVNDYAKQEVEEDVGETGRLFIRNLAYTVTEDDLKKLFEPFGKLSEIYIPIDRNSKKSKGIAFLLFMIPENAMRAMTEMDGKAIQGRLVHILPAKITQQSKQQQQDSNGQQNQSSSFKQQKEREQKAAAGATYNWNSLFMRSDAIISSLAERYKLTQGEVLDPNATDLAVRMTLMETHIINETKKFLEEEGVVIEKIGGKGIERSKTVILVKNIPHKTTQTELETMFSRFGELARVLLTPARTLALLEFYHVSEAKLAFQNLAYTKFHHVPLYLEWAPIGVFTKQAISLEDKIKQREQREQEQRQQEKQQQKLEKEQQNNNKKQQQDKNNNNHNNIIVKQENEEVDSSKPQQQQQQQDKQTFYVFVKNLNFDTTSETLRERFKSIRDFISVNVATKLHHKTGEKLSHGYGFAEFGTKQGAYECIKKWHNATVDGHEIVLKLSDKASATKELPANAKRSIDPTPANVVSTKISVKNIPFEASPAEVRKLFATYGELQSVRIPKKPTGGHRGFGFVQYLTEQEAKNAMDALRNSHLYGRHLVLEFAELDKNIDQLRQKATEEYNKLKK
ncbi:RNA-binding region RNP-1 domain-containing protein [Heterostelium album PN500]|uniref:RNA-binding region RNP-1 domain-containing protein n=1 Tax=Heterostelium pallidum (strain ATCC 26659 / Pp 5 / PN500) TaxID=670386 RepID=D3BR13_HETP5|nr:RNA-binding region RNP-1 domain-containing protein [Heterostelium album PN500]EFA76199.1 RNA-binding region RNP-1 domain-containing protein [Heterostelium album PN500]|eukprot:XP_020428332.1 RNA-binding region RNP-1 domain-containing protein [Heterostelium album PN500]